MVVNVSCECAWYEQFRTVNIFPLFFFSTCGQCWMSFRCNRNSWALEFIVASVIVAVVVEWSG